MALCKPPKKFPQPSNSKVGPIPKTATKGPFGGKAQSASGSISKLREPAGRAEKTPAGKARIGNFLDKGVRDRTPTKGSGSAGVLSGGGPRSGFSGGKQGSIDGLKKAIGPPACPPQSVTRAMEEKEGARRGGGAINKRPAGSITAAQFSSGISSLAAKIR